MMFGKKVRLDTMSQKGKYLILAMDQGFEHGPADFNDINIDPDYVLDIAEKSPVGALAIQKGIALKYMDPFCTRVPLLLKLNGKTNIAKEHEPYSQVNASVRDAVQMGAVAVGFTIYVGSPVEWRSYKVLGEIERECRDYGMPLVVWSYPRGPDVVNKTGREMVAYSARVALELGADLVKVYYTGDPSTFKWVVKSGGKMPVLVAGGTKKGGAAFLQDVSDIMQAGALGMAIGRNIWQHKHPVEMAKAIASIIYDGNSPENAAKMVPKE